MMKRRSSNLEGGLCGYFRRLICLKGSITGSLSDNCDSWHNLCWTSSTTFKRIFELRQMCRFSCSSRCCFRNDPCESLCLWAGLVTSLPSYYRDPFCPLSLILYFLTVLSEKTRIVGLHTPQVSSSGDRAVNGRELILKIELCVFDPSRYELPHSLSLIDFLVSLPVWLPPSLSLFWFIKVSDTVLLFIHLDRLLVAEYLLVLLRRPSSLFASLTIVVSLSSCQRGDALFAAPIAAVDALFPEDRVVSI